MSDEQRSQQSYVPLMWVTGLLVSMLMGTIGFLIAGYDERLRNSDARITSLAKAYNVLDKRQSLTEANLAQLREEGRRHVERYDKLTQELRDLRLPKRTYRSHTSEE